jgi:hypothetical protein
MFKRKKSRSEVFVDQVSASADAAADAAKRAAKTAADRTAPLFDAASGRVVPVAHAARDAAGPTVALAREKAEPVIAKATPLFENAKARAGDMAHDLAPHVEHARDRLVDDVVPRVGAAVTGALAASAPYREEAARRGGAALAALKGEVEVPKKKRHIGRNLLVVSGIAGLVALAYKYLTGESKSSGWQTPSGTTYTPPRPAGPDAPAAPDAPATAPDGTVEDPEAALDAEVTAAVAGEAPADVADETGTAAKKKTP